jgi:hypothetical protein
VELRPILLIFKCNESANRLIEFSPEPSVFASAVEKRRSYIIQGYNFACGSV